MMARAALLQMNSSPHVEENLKGLAPFFMKAKDDGAEIILLPENFAFMGLRITDNLAIAEEFGQGEIQRSVSQLAKRYNLWVIAGTIPVRMGGDRVRASCLVYDNDGVCVARYDKIHLFDVHVSTDEAYQESLVIDPGEHLVVVDTPVGRVGLSVCYDLRFPELYRQLVLKGAELFSVSSAFTAVTGMAHWETLLRTRAIENLCYVLAPNQGGTHANGRNTHGHSMIIGPWGDIQGELPQGVGLVVADVDLSRLHQLRLQFPCNDHHVL